MTIKLTHKKCYELHKDTFLSLILSFQLANKDLTPEDISAILGINLRVVNRILQSLRTDQAIE